MTLPPRPPGPIAEEATRLLHAAQAWARAVPVGAPHPHDGGEPPPCRACPLCQALAMVREARPEALTHFGDAVESFALAVRAALDGHTRATAPAAGEGDAGGAAGAGAGSPGGDAARAPAPGRVQHIDIA